MTDVERRMQAFTETSSYMQRNGLKLCSAEMGKVCITAQVTQEMHNHHHVVHGGYLLGIADNVAGMAALTSGSEHVTQSCSCQFISNVGAGQLFATGTVLHQGRTVANVQVEIINEQGKLLMACLFSMYRLNRPAPEIPGEEVKPL